jgi:hypothetical protein
LPLLFMGEGRSSSATSFCCSSTSRRDANVEVLKLLHPGSSQCHRPKWRIPHDCDAGQDVERSILLRLRRTQSFFFSMFHSFL